MRPFRRSSREPHDLHKFPRAGSGIRRVTNTPDVRKPEHRGNRVRGTLSNFGVFAV